MARARATRTLEEIDAELVELRQERRAFARSVNQLLREDLLDLVDRRVAEASAGVEGLLAHLNPADGVAPLESVGRPGLLDMCALWSFASDEGLHEQMRGAIRDLPAELFVCSRAEATAKLADFDAKIAGLEQERLETEKAARLAEVEADYATAEGA